MDKPTILVIAGPTAAGKTAVSIAMAQRYGGEIVSCDSMQLYKYMTIGSAKPTKEEMGDVPHHMIDVIDPREDFSVAVYQEMATKAIDDILSRGKLPVICGGTGLYLNALLYDMDFGPSRRDDAYRQTLESFADEHGNEALHQRLNEADPSAAERIHPNNRKRVIRALEAAERDGKPLQAFEQVRRKSDSYNARLLGVTWDRPTLYQRIDDRVDQMLANGLEEEVRQLMEMGFTSDDIAMKGIGYKELLDYFAGLYPREEAVRLIKRNTRHYAKRQLTWFRRYEDMVWFNGSDYANTTDWLEDMYAWADRKS